MKTTILVAISVTDVSRVYERDAIYVPEQETRTLLYYNIYYYNRFPYHVIVCFCWTRLCI